MSKSPKNKKHCKFEQYTSKSYFVVMQHINTPLIADVVIEFNPDTKLYTLKQWIPKNVYGIDTHQLRRKHNVS